ncbi:MAG: PAN domain-containing protein, partial [Pseudolabrys sp.]
TKDVAVKGSVYKIQNTGTIEGCSTQCAADERCVMFEYWDNNTGPQQHRFRTAAGDLGSCYLFDRDFVTYQLSGGQVGVRTRPQ